MKKRKYYTLIEHSSLYICGSNAEPETRGSDIGIPKKEFEEIEQFVLENGDEAHRFLVPSFRKGLGKTLKASQYVGVIETHNGTVIEILPKIGDQTDPNPIRSTFMNMLKELRHSPFKHFETAHLNINRMNLLEIFINMFLEELTNLVKKGIKSDYIAREENSSFLKGRLKISEQILKNMVHKERFYVEFDEYEQNRVENRIIKSTLQFLYNKSSDSSNTKRIREFLFVFDSIDPITDLKQSFTKVKIDRQLKDYELVISWCRIFLNNESFTSFAGNSVAFALLFDMNKVFEDFVAQCLKKRGFAIETQIRGQYLLNDPDKYLLKPDLRINGKTIADTKWKVINTIEDISQSDIYQMFAYAKKYLAEDGKIYLIYPRHTGFPNDGKRTHIGNFGMVSVYLTSFDCENGSVALDEEVHL